MIHMKRLLLLTAIVLTACASGPRFEYELSQVYRPDGPYDAWKTTNVSNEFNRFVDSRAMGEKHNWSENVPFVRVVDDHYVGFNIGDGYICAQVRISAQMSWSKSGVASYVTEESFVLSDDDTMLEVEWDPLRGTRTTDRLMYMLNYFDKLAVQTSDTCGETRITRYDISGSHHVTTKQTDENGLSKIIKAQVPERVQPKSF